MLSLAPWKCENWKTLVYVLPSILQRTSTRSDARLQQKSWCVRLISCIKIEQITLRCLNTCWQTPLVQKSSDGWSRTVKWTGSVMKVLVVLKYNSKTSCNWLLSGIIFCRIQMTTRQHILVFHFIMLLGAPVPLRGDGRWRRGRRGKVGAAAKVIVLGEWYFWHLSGR